MSRHHFKFELTSSGAKLRDRRIAHAIYAIQGQPNLNAQELARPVQLSTSRLQHLDCSASQLYRTSHRHRLFSENVMKVRSMMAVRFLSTLALVLLLFSAFEKTAVAQGFSATGGTITYSGGYTIHTFTSSGTFTPNGSGIVEVLVVAGGGATSSLDRTGGGGGGHSLQSDAPSYRTAIYRYGWCRWRRQWPISF